MNRTAVEEIKGRLPIEEVIGGYIKLDKSGKSYKARCPFHNEKSPSFFVSPDRGGYYCFGCGAKGDIFSFVEQFEGLDFKGALKVLAEKAGVPLTDFNKPDSDRDNLFAIMEDAARYFEDQYAKSTDAKSYVNGRGISPETRTLFRIGWAPDGWSNLYTYLRKKGWKDPVIERAGLAKMGERKPDFYDRFRGRIMFPICDSSGRVIAFTGRILKDDGKSAKYLNSPDTPLFNKSQILFGLDKAKTEIRRVGYSVLVEGQMDLVLSHQVGVKNTVAASGTALGEASSTTTNDAGVVSNLTMVRRLSPNMIIALDSDAAGRAATMKAVASTALSMGMSVKIGDIQGGKDPADLILANPESWKDVLRNSKHVIEYELDNVIREAGDAHKIPKLLRDRVFPFLARIESEMDKAVFVKSIAEKAHISETAVWEDLKKVEKVLSQNAINAKNGTANSTQNTANLNVKKGIEPRLGLVERRMFGLLSLMEAKDSNTGKAYREEIKKIAGPLYESTNERLKEISSDIAFEAEAFFGADQNRWESHMKELVLNFEEDLVNDRLMAAMTELRSAEKKGEMKVVQELATECQVLSIRKAEIAKKRR